MKSFIFVLLVFVFNKAYGNDPLNSKYRINNYIVNNKDLFNSTNNSELPIEFPLNASNSLNEFKSDIKSNLISNNVNSLNSDNKVNSVNSVNSINSNKDSKIISSNSDYYNNYNIYNKDKSFYNEPKNFKNYDTYLRNNEKLFYNSNSYYYQVNKQKFGPYSIQQLNEWMKMGYFNDGNSFIKKFIMLIFHHLLSFNYLI